MLLPLEATTSAHEKLAEYARIRAFDTFSQPDLPIAQIVRRSEEIQHELWRQAVAHREHTNVRFYMDALSKLKNVHAERVTMGVHDRVPPFVWISLACVMALGMLTMGYQASLAGSRRARAMIPLIMPGARSRSPPAGDPTRRSKPNAASRQRVAEPIAAQTATSANVGSLANRATWCSWSPKSALSAYIRLK